MPHGQNLKGLAGIIKSDAVVADAQPELLRVRTFEQLDVPSPLNRNRANARNIRIALSRSMRRTSDRALSVHSILLAMSHAAKIFCSQTKILENVFVRNPLATMLAQPLFRVLH